MRLPEYNGRPRVFAALITVSNVECGKKDRDEYAAELVTDGGSRDPLCQPHRHRETARSTLKQQSMKQQSAKQQQSIHARHITRRGALFHPEEFRDLDAARFVKLAPVACDDRSKSRRTRNADLAITVRDTAINRIWLLSRRGVTLSSDLRGAARAFYHFIPITTIRFINSLRCRVSICINSLEKLSLIIHLIFF